MWAPKITSRAALIVRFLSSQSEHGGRQDIEELLLKRNFVPKALGIQLGEGIVLSADDAP